ncbi:MAG: cupin domain-containing protein [Desulfobacterales bacterium]|jgi:quercetin dioxygenase-like cupin family protein|nr:cupin domain-containing protein [Desulfobacterales bacterium]
MAIHPQDLKGLIDSTPAQSVLLNLAAFYAQRQLPETGLDSEVVYDCPRAQVMIRTAVKGTQIGAHFHTVCDEVVMVVGGRGELLINGEWRPVQAGDIHICPRGIVHDTRAPEENLQYISVFSPHLPPGTDINRVD